MVFWKSWPSWLKGGIIYTLLAVIFFFIGRQIYLMNSSLLGRIFLFPFLWHNQITWPLVGNSSIRFILLYGISVIQAFIIGALIGLVIGKLKKKKRPKKPETKTEHKKEVVKKKQEVKKEKQLTAKDKLDKIKKLLVEGRKHLTNKNIFGAKTTYRKIRRLHSTLKPGEKNKELHNQLLTFHGRLTKLKSK